MKANVLCAISISLIASSLASFGQCSNTIEEISYDTTVSGIGSTNTPYVFTFPKFDSETGTLTEVKLTSVLTLSYQYDIENTLASAQNHRLRLSRYDDISSDALMFPVGSALQIPQHPLWYNNNLAASDGLPGSGFDFRSVAPFFLQDNDTIIDEPLSNTADFLGPGTVSFDYNTSMSLTRSPVSGAQITNDGASDEITFRITYTYCSNIVLASDITSFTARKKGERVEISWSTANHRNGVKYELVKSRDGKTFTSVTQFGPLLSNPFHSYDYNYFPQPGERGNLVFRIKMTDENGAVKYSSLRVVNLGNPETRSGIRLLPNPAYGGDITLVLHNSQRSDWQVEIFNAAGQLMARKTYNNALVARLGADHRFSRGLYLVKATDLKTRQSHTERLIVK